MVENLSDIAATYFPERKAEHVLIFRDKGAAESVKDYVAQESIGNASVEELRFHNIAPAYRLRIHISGETPLPDWPFRALASVIMAAGDETAHVEVERHALAKAYKQP